MHIFSSKIGNIDRKNEYIKILNVQNFLFFSYKNLKWINIIKIIFIYTKKISKTNF